MTDAKERMQVRAERLIELLRINAPEIIVAREVFLIAASLKEFVDDETFSQAKFQIESDSI